MGFKKAHQIYVVCQFQCHYPPPAGRRRKAAQCQLSVNMYQLH